MISCQEAVRRLWEYLENDLDAGEREDVDGHLALCRRCCGEAEFTAELGQMLRSSSSPHLPHEVEAHLVGFLQSLEEEDR